MRITARTSSLALLVLVATTMLLAGCGDGGDSKTSSAQDGAAARAEGSGASKSGSGEQPTAELEVVLENVGGKNDGMMAPPTIACNKKLPATCRGTVTCPAEASDAEQVALCTWLGTDGIEVLTETVPENEACTMIYGGPETATVTGTVDGEEIDASFSRSNGCEIGRFDRAAPLWSGMPVATDPGAAAGSCPPVDPDAPVSSDDTKGEGTSADDSNCTPPAAPAVAPPAEPDVISDPPEAFS